MLLLQQREITNSHVKYLLGRAAGGNGGDTAFELKQKLSEFAPQYTGQKVVAFGGGCGGGVAVTAKPSSNFGDPCSFPRFGGSG